MRAKVEGREDLVEAPEAATETTVVDLMAALRASVERAKAGEKKRSPAAKPASATKERASRRKAS